MDSKESDANNNIISSINEIPKKYEEMLKSIIKTCCEFTESNQQQTEEIKMKLVNQYAEFDNLINESTETFIKSSITTNMVCLSKLNAMGSDFNQKGSVTNSQIVSQIANMFLPKN